MERRNIVLGFITLAIIALVLFVLYRNSKNEVSSITTLPSPTSEQSIESKFNVTIPDDLEKANLSFSGSDSSGIATRKFEGGVFSVDVLADLPDQPYQAWLVKNESEDIVLMGNMSPAKGGYILNFDISKDLNDHKKVVITSGRSSTLNNGKIVLQGSFN